MAKNYVKKHLGIKEVKSKWAAKACVVLATADGNIILIIKCQAAKHQQIGS